jgi:hypothetical protein
MTQKDAEEIVRGCYPDAKSHCHEAVYQMGQNAPYKAKSWAIYPAGGLGQEPLGNGPNEGAAWADAATTVLRELRKAEERETEGPPEQAQSASE